MNYSKLQIITKSNCHWCHVLKDFLDSKRVTYEELSVGDNITVEDALKLLNGVNTVPRVLIDGEAIGGYKDVTEQWEGVCKSYGPFEIKGE